MITVEEFRSELHNHEPLPAIRRFAKDRDIDPSHALALASFFCWDSWRLMARRMSIDARKVLELRSKFSVFVGYLHGSGLRISTDLPNNKIMQIAIPAIQYGISGFPYSHQFSGQLTDLLDNKSRAHIYDIDPIPGRIGLRYQGRKIGIRSCDDDYYKLDIIADFFTEETRIKSQLTKYGTSAIAYRKLAKRIVGNAIRIARNKRLNNIGSQELSDGSYRCGVQSSDYSK